MRILHIIKGLTGIGMIQATNLIPTTNNAIDVIKLITQVVICVATILALFKKKKK